MKTRYGFTKLTAVAALGLGFAGVASAQVPGLTGTTPILVSGVAIAHQNTSGVGVVTAVSGSASQSAIPRLGETNIAFSRHNLGTTGIQPNHTPQLFDDTGTVVVGTNQICVFCHTPHGFNTNSGATGVDGGGPLWNKSIKTTAYTTYNSVATYKTQTIDGEILPVGSVSLACLSCHDGTQAMDNMINGPGSGNFSQNGLNIGANQGYVFNEFATFGAGGAVAAGFMSLAAGNPTAEGINLSTDLSNDHPIGIQYCGGGFTVAAQSTAAAAGVATGTCGDRQFVKPKTAVINGQQAFWVDTDTMADPDAAVHGEPSAITRNPAAALTKTAAGDFTNVGDNVRTKSDLTLFNRTFVAGSGPSVECASCHDVHTANNGTFLRVSNYGSGLCLSCHVK